PAAAAVFKLYPGATTPAWAQKDRQAEFQNAGPDREVEIWTTPDSYRNVYEYYRALAPEWKRPAPVIVDDSTGEDIQWAFFVFDGARSIEKSRFYVRVQRPVFGETDVHGKPTDYHDVTEITVIRAKKAPDRKPSDGRAGRDSSR